MSDFWGDVRFGLRFLVRSPIFTVTSVLLLGVGIGVNTLIFSVVDTLLLRPLPVKHAEQLVRLIEAHPTGFVTYELPYALYEQVAKASNLSEALCQGDLDVAFEEGTAIERIRVNAVSGNFFSMLGIPAQLGRVLAPEDDSPGSLPAVMSYDFWQRWFAGSTAVIGRVIRLNRLAFTVIGVLPKGANGLTVDTSPDIRVPLTAGRLLVREPPGDPSGPFFLQIFGRLRPGVTLARAEAEIDSLLRATYEDVLIRENPKLASLPRKDIFDSRLRLEPAGNGVSPLRAQFSRGLVLLMAGVGLLLLMACANVACLLLARSAVRSQEIGMRLALGARPWRVARQLLTEGLVLALPGGVLGVLLAYAGMPLLLAALPPIRDRAAVVQPLAVHIHVDLRVLGFAMSASLLTALLSGLSPALQGARQDLAGSLRGSRTTTSRLTARNVLVVAQIAVCVLLLTGASLLMETFDRMRSMNAGFDRDHIVTFTVDPGLKGYQPDRARLLGRQFLAKTQSLPGSCRGGDRLARPDAGHGCQRYIRRRGDTHCSERLPEHQPQLGDARLFRRDGHAHDRRARFHLVRGQPAKAAKSHHQPGVRAPFFPRPEPGGPAVRRNGDGRFSQRGESDRRRGERREIPVTTRRNTADRLQFGRRWIRFQFCSAAPHPGTARVAHRPGPESAALSSPTFAVNVGESAV